MDSSASKEANTVFILDKYVSGFGILKSRKEIDNEETKFPKNNVLPSPNGSTDLSTIDRNVLNFLPVGKKLDKNKGCCSWVCWKKRKSFKWKKKLTPYWAVRGFKTHRKPRDDEELPSNPAWSHRNDYTDGKRQICGYMLREELKRNKKKKQQQITRESKNLCEEKFSFVDETTILGKIAGNVLPSPEDNIYEDLEFKEQAKFGVQLIDQVTEKPLSKYFDRALHVFIHVLFFVNLVVQVYDLAIEPIHFHYKVTAVVIGVLENCIVWTGLLVMRHPKVKNSPDYHQHLKHQQYVENIVAEIMIYPMIILTVVGFAAGKDYKVFVDTEVRKDIFKWIQMFLLLADTAYLTITQIVRLRMLYKLLKDIQNHLNFDGDLNLTGNWSLAGRIMVRSHITVIGNIVLFIVLVVMFGAQVHKDNYDSEDFHLTTNSGVIMVCLILLPFYSIGLFLFVNYFWIMEVLLQINLSLARQDELLETLQEYGDVIKAAFSVAKEKLKASEEKLEIIKKTPRWRKLLYGFSELHVIILLFFYQAIMVGSCFVFEGFNDDIYNWIVRVIFLVILIIVNGHIAVMAVISNIVILLLGVGVLFYPFCILICCSNQLRKEAVDTDNIVVEDYEETVVTSRDVTVANIETNESKI